jgi:hypothetical protein
MKKLFYIACWLTLIRSARAQMVIHDQSIIYQQERMVFKQWDKNDFTPKPGFLYTNPLYWLTWAWYPDYKNTDLRPLGPSGPQTQRLALVAALQNTENAYKLQADTLRNTALSEAVKYSGLLSDADPLWLLYYSKELKDLINQQDADLLNGISVKVRHYLQNSGTYQWYLNELHSLQERLQTARTTTLDRGSRILTYHRLLNDYRKLSSLWETKKAQAGTFINLSEQAARMHTLPALPSTPTGGLTDQQIADQILKYSKL